jgi:hypothetical protein
VPDATVQALKIFWTKDLGRKDLGRKDLGRKDLGRGFSLD